MSDLLEGPWQSLALDFYGPLDEGSYLLVIIDEYSRYVVVKEVKTASAMYVLPELHETLSMFGIPKKFKSYNGASKNHAILGTSQC
jgi:hypothetical protein